LTSARPIWLFWDLVWQAETGNEHLLENSQEIDDFIGLHKVAKGVKLWRSDL
jgi:hypothetical protein